MENRPAASRIAFLQLHLLVVVFASTTILGHLISLGAPSLVIWRTAIAAIGGALLVGLVFRRSVLPPRGAIPGLLGVGAIVGVHWMAMFGAIRLANVSICLAGLATISFFTAFTEPWLEKRRIRPFEVLLGLLVVSGIVLVAGFERDRLPGLFLALLSALLAAVFPVLNRRIVRRQGMDPLVMVVWEMVGACLISLAVLPWLEGPGAFLRLADWRGFDGLWIVVLALFCTVFAHAAHIALLRHISAYSSNLAINFEPVYGILAAALLFGEHRQLHPGFFAGTATIFAANLLHPWILRRQRASAVSVSPQ